MESDLPAGLLGDAGLVAVRRLPAREAGMWLVDWGGTPGVLRRLDPVPGWAAGADLAADTAWAHDFLQRLADRGFPAPRPLPVFGQRSWAATSAGFLEVLSFVPGDVVGWDDRVPMEAVGALLAGYHDAACQVRAGSQRPVALPLARAAAVLISVRPRAAGGQDEQMRLLRELAGDLAVDLERVGHDGMPRLVVHGDFTSDNVVAGGRPYGPCGVIDFALAHLESPLADIGYALWRSGRPYPEATWVDVARVRRFVRGYASVRPLSGHEAAAIPVYLRGRGLQILAKRVLSGRLDLSPLSQVRWLTSHERVIADAVAEATR